MFCCSQAGAQTSPPLQLKPHHATAAVANLDRAIAWYQTVLGMKVINRGSRANGVRFADLQMPLFGIGLTQDPAAAATTAATRPVGSGWVHIVFSVPDAASAYITLKARGAEVITRGNVPPAEIKSFLVHDSEGNEIEIVQEL